jgi:N-acetylglutamate synthase
MKYRRGWHGSPCRKPRRAKVFSADTNRTVGVKVDRKYNSQRENAAAVRIAAMRVSDYRAALGLWRTCKGVSLHMRGADSAKAVDAYLRRNNGCSSVGFDGARLVGCVLAGHDGRRGFLHHLAVARQWRGRGIARALVQRSLDQLARAGIERAWVFVLTGNTTGQAFWRAAGWEPGTHIRMFRTEIPRTARRGRR